MPDSIRRRLFAALAGFTLLICLCYTGLALVIAYVTEDMLVDRLLARAAAQVTAGASRPDVPGVPGDAWVRVYGDAARLPPAVQAQVAAGRARAEVFADGGAHYHYRTLDLATPAGPRRVYLVADAGPLLVVSALVRDVGGVFAAAACGLVALALLLAWLLTRRLVAPLLTLAEEVRNRAPGSHAPFSASARRDEIGFLANRLEASLGDLHAALAREHAFTRDVGHELRTPLAVMRNTLVQAGTAPGAAVPGATDVAQLQAQLDGIGKTVDVLFALARAEHVAHETFDLRACIEDCLLRLLDDGARTDVCLLLDLPDRLDVRGNPHLATLLLNNCVGNALFHGGPGCQLRLAVADGVLAIENTVDPARPGRMHGFLHGQDLLRRIAAALRWELRLHAGAARYRVDIVPLRAP